MDSRSVTGIGGGFENIATLTGGAGADRFMPAGGSLTGLLSGGSGNNSLTGGNGANNWAVTGLDAGTVNGLTLGFTTIGSLIGSTGSDQFGLTAAASADRSQAEDRPRATRCRAPGPARRETGDCQQQIAKRHTVVECQMLPELEA